MAEITEWFVKQYKDAWMHIYKQAGSKLRGTTITRTGVVGKETYFERAGITAARKRTVRHEDSKFIDFPHSRRRVSLTPYDWEVLLDKPDQVRTLVDPTGPYAEEGGMAMGRAIDDVIIAALGGNAYSGEDGATKVALPASQKIAADDPAGGSNEGLTIHKIRKARRIMEANEVTDLGDWVFVASPQGKEQLLATTEATSSDFVGQVRALVDGVIDHFLGYRFIWSNRLPLSGDIRSCYAYDRRSVALAIGEDIRTRIQEEGMKKFSTHVFLSMDLGASRLQEEGVVEVKIDESVVV